MATVLKLCLVGNGSAGKTSICTRFREDGFQRVYRQTVGLDFYEKPLRVRDSTVTVQVWDIGGQSLGSKMLGQYVWGASIVFLCYDVTDAGSFADAVDWLALLRRPPPAGSSGDGARAAPAIYLVGNKVDLEQLRRVSDNMHDKFIAEHGLTGGFLVSARSGEGVLTAFYACAAAWLGVEPSAMEMELTKAVLTVRVAAAGGADDARLPGADEIEAADAAAMATAAKGGCCAVS
jgi:Ras-related protein Rab-28